MWEVFLNSGRDEKSWIQLTQRDGKQIVGGSCSRNHHGLDSDLPDKYTNTLIYKNTNIKHKYTNTNGRWQLLQKSARIRLRLAREGEK